MTNAPPPTIAALFVDPRGCYAGLPGVEIWDEERDARLYHGPHPVVAHPPCARWCRLAKLVESRGGPAVGDDRGCFAAALVAVRKWGGVLEHPAWSIAWGVHGLLAPPTRGWSKSLIEPNEWVAEVSQACYGHRAQKMTWLLYVGPGLPRPLDTSKPRGALTVTTSMGNGKTVEMSSHKERSATPRAFRDVLIAMARGITG